jgi:hypothetical protein
MKRIAKLTHKFVEFIPEVLKEGVLYVSMENETVIHKCCCGCGNEVVTPLSPTDWTLIFDGRSVTLYPSIGNWGFECQSHYWIKADSVQWSGRWSSEDIEAGRAADGLAKMKFFEGTKVTNDLGESENSDSYITKTFPIKEGDYVPSRRSNVQCIQSSQLRPTQRG